jgi:hypothetical protein
MSAYRDLFFTKSSSSRYISRCETYVECQINQNINKFWLLMSEVIGIALVPLAYEARLQTLLTHGVGLWDVVAEAHRPGSLDSAIRHRDDNDCRACWRAVRASRRLPSTAARPPSWA